MKRIRNDYFDFGFSFTTLDWGFWGGEAMAVYVY